MTCSLPRVGLPYTLRRPSRRIRQRSPTVHTAACELACGHVAAAEATVPTRLPTPLTAGASSVPVSAPIIVALVSLATRTLLPCHSR